MLVNSNWTVVIFVMHSCSGWLAIMPMFIGVFILGFGCLVFFKSTAFSYQKVKITTFADLISYSLPSPQPARMALHTLLVRKELKSAGAEGCERLEGELLCWSLFWTDSVQLAWVGCASPLFILQWEARASAFWSQHVLSPCQDSNSQKLWNFLHKAAVPLNP